MAADADCKLNLKLLLINSLGAQFERGARLATPTQEVRQDMRSLAIGILISAITAGACNRTPPSATSADEEKKAGLASASAGNAKDSLVAWRETTIPAGATLAIALETPVSSDTSRSDEPVTAHLTRPAVVDGVTVVPIESVVSGVVTDATRAGKVKGRAYLALRFDTLVPMGRDERYSLRTKTITRTAPSETKKDTAKIAIPAAGGAVVGGIVGGKKGAVIGGAVGGGAGTAVVLSERGQEVHLSRGTAISLTLTEPVTVRARIEETKVPN